MAQTEVNEILQTPGIEEKIMKATGLTKNVIAKMLCNANETEDEVEKARILSHFIWHMPAGQLQATPEAKAAKKELIQELANEIGTEMPEEWSSVEIVVKPNEDKNPEEETKEDDAPVVDNAPVEDAPTTDAPEGGEPKEETPSEDAELKTEETVNPLLFKFTKKEAKVKNSAAKE